MQNNTIRHEQYHEDSVNCWCCVLRRVKHGVTTTRRAGARDFVDVDDLVAVNEWNLGWLFSLLHLAWICFLFGLLRYFGDPVWVIVSSYLHKVLVPDTGDVVGLLNGDQWVYPGDCELSGEHSHAGGHADFLCRSI